MPCEVTEKEILRNGSEEKSMGRSERIKFVPDTIYLWDEYARDALARVMRWTLIFASLSVAGRST